MKPKTLSPKDIGGTNSDDWTDAIEIAGGYSVRVEITYDQDYGAPWDEADGHGPVRKSRYSHRSQDADKRPGEVPLNSPDRNEWQYFYDYAEAIKIARRDGWDAEPYGTGTKGERAVRAVDRDMEFLRSWINDEWHWIVVGVEVSRNGEILNDGPDYCGGIESEGDYWKEFACESANSIIAQDRRERKAEAIAARIEKRERAYWFARDVLTIERNI